MKQKNSENNPETLLYQAAQEIQDFFVEKEWKFAFIGGLALLRWGAIRATEDVDGALLTLFSNEEQYVDTILENFKPRIPDARNHALYYRVLLLTASNGVGIDFSLGGLQYEEDAVRRSSMYEYTEDYVLRTCSAEDLIVYKAFAARDKDWADVHGILQRQRGKLDFDIIFDNLTPLVELKEAPEILVKLNDMIRNTK
jgi:hypothetical protein